MPIQLHSEKGTELYHRKPIKKAPRYSIFGSKALEDYFAYTPISNVERNNRGFFSESTTKEPSYYHRDIVQPKTPNPIDVPVWTLIDQHPSTSTITHQFVWPYGGSQVVLTGDFDDWKGTVNMTPLDEGTEGVVVFKAEIKDLDPTVDICYKFIVDGKWCFDAEKDHVKDKAGNVNNIIYAREKKF